MYELKLEKFSGPLDKLLKLIEEKKLGVTEVSLAQVTDDFLRYLKTLTARAGADFADGVRPRGPLSSAESATNLRLVADFIAVASRLILIKSKFLLPNLTLTGEEEEGIKDLERRLRLYQEMKPMMKNIQRLWRGKKSSFGRPYFLELPHSADSRQGGVFYPGRELEVRRLAEAAEKLFEAFQKFVLDTETIKDKIITVEEKIAEVVERLERESESTLKRLGSAKSRTEIIALFLAVLHLAREQLVMLEQTERFSDILIKRK